MGEMDGMDGVDVVTDPASLGICRPTSPQQRTRSCRCTPRVHASFNALLYIQLPFNMSKEPRAPAKHPAERPAEPSPPRTLQSTFPG